MSIKWFSLALTVMSLFFFMFLVTAAMAQDGYLIYQGPTDSQCYTKAKVYKKVATKAKVRKIAKVRRSCDMETPGDSLYDRPEYPAYVARRFSQNPMGYSGYVDEAGMPAGRVARADYTDIHIGHRRNLMSDQAGDNADLLANVMPGYMRTRQIDLIGNDMFVFESGVDVPKRYFVEYLPNDRVMIKDLRGRKAGNGVIQKTDSDGAATDLLTNATTASLHDNRYLTANTNWDYAGPTK